MIGWLAYFQLGVFSSPLWAIRRLLFAVAATVLAISSLGSALRGQEANDRDLAARQQRLERRFEELNVRFRELAEELRTSEPEQAARVAATLEQAGELRIEARLKSISAALAKGEREGALEEQRQVLEDLAKLQRRLLTGETDSPPMDDLAGEISTLLAQTLARQKTLTSSTRDLLARRPEDGSWRRADRLAIARLGADEKALAEPLTPLLERIADSPALGVVRAVVSEVRDELQAIGGDLTELKATAELTGRQRSVEATLEELLSALRPKSAEREPPADSPPPEEEETTGGIQLPKSIELRLLRKAQQRLHERTRVFHAAHADQEATEASRRELLELARRQAELETQVLRLLEQP
jgi:hypothetical protein